MINDVLYNIKTNMDNILPDIVNVEIYGDYKKSKYLNKKNYIKRQNYLELINIVKKQYYDLRNV